MNRSLISTLENARLRIIGNFNQIVSENEIPMYLYESILLEMLSDVRNQKNVELSAEIDSLNRELFELKKGEDTNEKTSKI